jgi:hypothetical protein
MLDLWAYDHMLESSLESSYCFQLQTYYYYYYFVMKKEWQVDVYLLYVGFLLALVNPLQRTCSSET